MNINRREMLGTVVALAAAPSVDRPSGMPEIKFHSAQEISNLDELFNGVEWQERFQTSAVDECTRHVICWLPKDRAVRFSYSEPNKNAVYFYGIVKVHQTKHDYKFNGKTSGWLSSPGIQRVDESIIELRNVGDTPTIELFLPYEVAKKEIKG